MKRKEKVGGSKSGEGYERRARMTDEWLMGKRERRLKNIDPFEKLRLRVQVPTMWL